LGTASLAVGCGFAKEHVVCGAAESAAMVGSTQQVAEVLVVGVRVKEFADEPAALARSGDARY
jgi:hypothetical protein